jgi:hypothetical protein
MENHQEDNKNLENEYEKNKQQNAIASLIQGVLMAQKKGAYSLEEAAELYKAVSVFINKNEKETSNIF